MDIQICPQNGRLPLKVEYRYCTLKIFGSSDATVNVPEVAELLLDVGVIIHVVVDSTEAGCIRL